MPVEDPREGLIESEVWHEVKKNWLKMGQLLEDEGVRVVAGYFEGRDLKLDPTGAIPGIKAMIRAGSSMLVDLPRDGLGVGSEITIKWYAVEGGCRTVVLLRHLSSKGKPAWLFRFRDVGANNTDENLVSVDTIGLIRDGNEVSLVVQNKDGSYIRLGERNNESRGTGWYFFDPLGIILK